MTDIDLGLCQCCENEPAVGVASIPGVPMSIAWGRKCLDAMVVPYWVAVANTAQIGGWQEAAEWWKQTVADTLAYFGKTMDEYLADVTADIAHMEEEEAKYREEEEHETAPQEGDDDW